MGNDNNHLAENKTGENRSAQSERAAKKHVSITRSTFGVLLRGLLATEPFKTALAQIAGGWAKSFAGAPMGELGDSIESVVTEALLDAMCEHAKRARSRAPTTPEGNS